MQTYDVTQLGERSQYQGQWGPAMIAADRLLIKFVKYVGSMSSYVLPASE